MASHSFLKLVLIGTKENYKSSLSVEPSPAEDFSRSTVPPLLFQSSQQVACYMRKKVDKQVCPRRSQVFLQCGLSKDSLTPGPLFPWDLPRSGLEAGTACWKEELVLCPAITWGSQSARAEKKPLLEMNVAEEQDPGEKPWSRLGGSRRSEQPSCEEPWV